MRKVSAARSKPRLRASARTGFSTTASERSSFSPSRSVDGQSRCPVPTDYQVREATNRRMRLLAVIDQELDKATSRFDRFNSPHEGWAVIREELDELWEHVRGNTGRGEGAMVEAVQIATMALRYVYDL